MVTQLRKILGDVKENEPLVAHTTFKIGGPARYFFMAQSADDIIKAVKTAVDLHLPYFILGGGSNVLVADQGFNGLVIKIHNSSFQIHNSRVIVGAGAPLGVLVQASVEQGLAGLEWGIGIPGTIGGAVRGNGGAFGGEMKDVVEKVRVLAVGSNLLLWNSPPPEADRARRSQLQATKAPRPGSNSPRAQIVPTASTLLEIKEFTGGECQFGYRDSVFKHDRNLIILEVELALRRGVKEELVSKMRDFLKHRSLSQPKEPSAGCIFKNLKLEIKDGRVFTSGQPVPEQLMQALPQQFKERQVIPVRWLVEYLGLADKSIGRAKISPLHCNFIVNTGQARAKDCLTLMDLIKNAVFNSLGLQLTEEVELVGF